MLYIESNEVGHRQGRNVRQLRRRRLAIIGASSVHQVRVQLVQDIPQTALKKIEANRYTVGKIVNGWIVTMGLGTYGPNDYLKRATVAAFGWPANQEKDAVYPFTEVGQKLTGANKYTLTFAKGETPPVKGFWSITMYMIEDGWWLTPIR